MGSDDHYTRKSAEAALQSVVFHAKKIGFTVTAECVETYEIMKLLQRMGVNHFQGYYIAKPVPFDEIYEPLANIVPSIDWSHILRNPLALYRYLKASF